VNRDEIVESIRSVCAPLPECRALCDRVVAEVELRFDAMTLATEAFAQYAMATNTPPPDAVADFESGFIQDARLRQVGRG